LKRWQFVRRLLLQVLVAWVFLEVVLRLTVPHFPGSYRTGLIWDNHPALGRYHVPSASTWCKTPEFTAHSAINSLGLRDLERSYAKEPGVFRILVLGDSFVEAVQVPLETAFTRVLERLLSAQSHGQRIEVINGGVMAYSTDQELLFLEREGLKYHPDLVILLFLDSDVRGNSRQLNSDNSLAARKPYFEIADGNDLRLVGVADRSAILAAGETILRRMIGCSYLATVIKTGVIDTTSARLSASAREQELPRDFCVYSHTVTPDWEAAWSLTEMLIERVRASAESCGARFLLVMAGEPHQVYSELFDQHVVRYHLQAEDWDADLPNRRIKEIAQRHGWQLLDLLPAFRRATAGSPPLHFMNDGHWTVEGHQLAAIEISRNLVEQHMEFRPSAP